MVGRLGLTVLCAGVLVGTALAAGANPRDPQKRHNPADQAWAQAIRIHRADLSGPGWSAQKSSDDDDSDGPADCKNPDLSDLVLTGEAEDPDFNRLGSTVISSSEVWANERSARSAWVRRMRIPFGKCLLAGFEQEAGRSTGVKITILSSGPLRIPKLAPRMLTFGIRFRMKVSGSTIEGRFSFYGLARGRADATLAIMSFGKPFQPIPQSLERRLAGLVAQRLHR